MESDNLILKGMKDYGRRNLVYQVFNNPHVYFVKLFYRTLSIGFFTLILSLIYTNTGLHEIKIPSTMHSLIGIVIGLLLVFRTNTAYDRWWEGRKSLSSISTAISFFIIKYNASFAEIDKESDKFIESTKEIKSNLLGFLNNLKKYLQNNANGHTIHVSDTFHKEQMRYMYKVLVELHNLERAGLIPSRDVSVLENSINKLLDNSNTCERIKNTPIPMAYALHIKMSIFIYLMTLPFGLFYDLGVWATPIIMLIYYLIAGIEIISSEIENPFAGDPNDLPTEELINSIVGSLNN